MDDLNISDIEIKSCHMESKFCQPLSVVAVINDLSDLSWSDIKLLALQLKVKLNTLEDIGNDYKGDDRKVQAIQAWLNNDPDASWEMIVEALQRMGMSAVADDIASKQDLVVTASSVPDFHPNDLHVCEEPTHQPPIARMLTMREVKEEIKQLKIKFISLVTKSRLALGKRESENPEFLEQFRDALLLLPVTNKPLHEKFFERYADEILAAIYQH